MKDTTKIVGSILFILLGFLCFGQSAPPVLKGKVIEYSTKKRYLNNVEISANYAANHTVSKDTGYFKLTFLNKAKKGWQITLRAQYGNWIIVNTDAMKTSIPNNPDIRPVKIVMSPPHLIDSVMIAYYDISTDYITKKYDAQIAVLNAEIADQHNEIIALESEKARLINLAQDLSEKFAIMHFEDVTESHTKARELYQLGEIDKAILVLQEVNSKKILNDAVEHKEQLTNTVEEIEQELAKTEDVISEQLEKLKFETDLLSLNGQFDEAKANYEFMLSMFQKANIDLEQELKRDMLRMQYLNFLFSYGKFRIAAKQSNTFLNDEDLYIESRFHYLLYNIQSYSYLWEPDSSNLNLIEARKAYREVKKIDLTEDEIANYEYLFGFCKGLHYSITGDYKKALENFKRSSNHFGSMDTIMTQDISHYASAIMLGADQITEEKANSITSLVDKILIQKKVEITDEIVLLAGFTVVEYWISNDRFNAAQNLLNQLGNYFIGRYRVTEKNLESVIQVFNLKANMAISQDSLEVAKKHYHNIIHVVDTSDMDSCVRLGNKTTVYASLFSLTEQQNDLDAINQLMGLYESTFQDYMKCSSGLSDYYQSTGKMLLATIKVNKGELHEALNTYRELYKFYTESTISQSPSYQKSLGALINTMVILPDSILDKNEKKLLLKEATNIYQNLGENQGGYKDEQARTMMNMARTFLPEQPDSAILYSKNAYDLCDEKSYSLKSSISYQISNYYKWKDNPGMVKKYTQKAITEYSQLKNIETTKGDLHYANMYNNLAFIYRLEGDEENLVKYLKLASKHEHGHHQKTYSGLDRMPIVLNDNQLGDYYYSKQQIDSAIAYYTKAIILPYEGSLYSNELFCQALAYNYYMRTKIYHGARMPDSSDYYFKKFIEVDCVNDALPAYKISKSEMYYFKSSVEMYKKNSAIAETYINNGLELIEGIDDVMADYIRSQMWNGLYRIKLSTNRELAQSYFLKVLDFEENRDTLLPVNHKNSLATLYIEAAGLFSSDTIKSFTYLSKAKKIYEEQISENIDNNYGVGNCLWSKGRILVQQYNDYKKSINAFKEAEDYLRKVKSKEDLNYQLNFSKFLNDYGIALREMSRSDEAILKLNEAQTNFEALFSINAEAVAFDYARVKVSMAKTFKLFENIQSKKEISLKLLNDAASTLTLIKGKHPGYETLHSSIKKEIEFWKQQ